MKRYIVFLKQVPLSTKVDLDPVTKTLKRSSALSQTNPDDLYALQMALDLKRQSGAEVIAVSMGPASAETVLREALQRMEIELPCAVMVSRENGKLSCMTLSGWRRAQQQEILHWNEKDMGIDVSSVGLHASPTRVVSTAVPVRKKEIKWCTGAADFAEAIRI